MKGTRKAGAQRSAVWNVQMHFRFGFDGNEVEQVVRVTTVAGDVLPVSKNVDDSVYDHFRSSGLPPMDVVVESPGDTSEGEFPRLEKHMVRWIDELRADFIGVITTAKTYETWRIRAMQVLPKGGDVCYRQPVVEQGLGRWEKEKAALESEVRRLTDELRAAKAAADAANVVAAKLQEQSEALRFAGAQERGAAEAAPVPAAIEPLPKELEQVLGREAIWSLVRPADGADSRSVVERHEVFWKRFDQVLEERGPEGSQVLRKPLQEYIDALSGLEFERNLKKKLASRLSFMMRAIGLRIRFDGEVGALVAYGHKGVGGFRIQYCDPGVGAGRVYKGLGACLPAGVELVAEPPRRVPRMDSKLGRYKNL